MKIYTKSGDTGETGLFSGPRVTKDDPRIEAYGTVDELNAVLGWCRTGELPDDVDRELERIQHELFVVGAQLATPDPQRLNMTLVGWPQIAELERTIDRMETALTPLTQFILPGGSPAAASIHMARTVCRRAERRVVAFVRSVDDPHSSLVITYLNRLGDLLFVMARYVNRYSGDVDVVWRQPTGA